MIRTHAPRKRPPDHSPQCSCEVCFDAKMAAASPPPASLNEPEPPPSANDKPPVWGLVVEDMRERDRTGRAKYGVPLQPHNGRDALVDAYQESLDLAVYLRQAIYERDGR
jgi:hypothetical protein